ncbi:hypothetical protein [Actinoplanes sp. TFC3]|uniref:hypothetical protein n=1 Tax=Actinoplanes sp. TFC3 TaxID=1710355 RepID=UPI0012900366|nr:hypothetical protein [Actinoplanes sp. TFC3]
MDIDNNAGSWVRNNAGVLVPARLGEPSTRGDKETPIPQRALDPPWARAFQHGLTVLGFLTSVAALAVAVIVMRDQARTNEVAREQAVRALASRVTFREISGKEAKSIFSKAGEVIQVQNRSISGIDWLIFEGEHSGADNRWYLLPELPPCSSISFPSPPESAKDEYLEIEALYFYNQDGWWWRGDAGTLRQRSPEPGPGPASAKIPVAGFDEMLLKQMESGVLPYKIEDLDACQ